MAENEESEIFGDMGRILQAAAGASLQNAEQRARINQARDDHAARSVAAQHSADQNVARNIKQDFNDREFWRTATPESVVDRLTVARSLAAQHPEASSAYMRGVDVIRKDYDLNISQIGRDHTDLGQYRTVATAELEKAFSKADTAAAQVHAQKQTQQNFQAQAAQASSLEREVYRNEFWQSAGSESIADRVIVAQQLSADHPAAQTAYLHASDVLRTNYGINIEDMNRDHPTSPEDRQAALREALDDYFARNQLEAEQKGAAASAENETEAGNESEAAAEESRAASLGADADRAAASESANLAEADKAGAEAHQDREHTRAEETTGGRQPHPYSRTSDAELAKVASVDPSAAEARRITAPNASRPAHGAGITPYRTGKAGPKVSQAGRGQEVEATR